MPLTGNKGEWSEIYVLFKLLSEQILYAGNHQLEKISTVGQPLLQILRKEKNKNLIFQINNETRQVSLLIGGEEIQNAHPSLFEEQAISLLKNIQTHKKGPLASPRSEAFMNDWYCHVLKAPSHDKADITTVIYDPSSFSQHTLGYSIKSQLGSPPSLLNASQATGMIFNIIGKDISDDEIEKTNAIVSKNKIRDRLKYLAELGCQLQFVKASNSIFENNLRIIDSLFPELYASMVQFYYSSADTSINTLTKHLATSNPLDCKTDKKFEFYAYKVKKFLCDLALGMMPATEWLGQYDHTNGYLVVKKNGDVLSYHIFHRNLFEDYLFSQTKFDTPSVKRHKFGVVLKNDQVCKIILNAQIRFIQ